MRSREHDSWPKRINTPNWQNYLGACVHMRVYSTTYFLHMLNGAICKTIHMYIIRTVHTIRDQTHIIHRHKHAYKHAYTLMNAGSWVTYSKRKPEQASAKPRNARLRKRTAAAASYYYCSRRCRLRHRVIPCCVGPRVCVYRLRLVAHATTTRAAACHHYHGTIICSPPLRMAAAAFIQTYAANPGAVVSGQRERNWRTGDEL